MRKTIGLLAAAAIVWLCAGGSAGAYPASGRAAVTGTDQVTALRAGGSGTLFSLAVPRSARCAGDSAHDGYRLYSFLIPVGHTPQEVSFTTTVPSKWFGMYTVDEYYMGFLAPGSGQVVDIPPNFTWSRLTAGMLIPPGLRAATWTAGLACTSGRYQVQNYWSADFRFERSSSDPQQFVWSVVNPAAPPGASGNFWLGLLPFGIAALFVILAVILGRNSKLGRRPAPRRNPEGVSNAQQV